MKSLLSSLKQKKHNLFFFLSPLLIFSIRENSMVPLLHSGDKVLISRLHKIIRGDVVVIKNPQLNIEIPYLIKKVTKIKNDLIYVEGINKRSSIDSRIFGWVPKRSIIGKMIIKF